MYAFLFFVFADAAVGFGVNLLVQRHPIYSAISLIGVMASLASLYLREADTFTLAWQCFAKILSVNPRYFPVYFRLADAFIRHYYRYADHMYACFQSQQSSRQIRSTTFPFDLYASGEYSRMLEREWQDSIDAS